MTTKTFKDLKASQWCMKGGTNAGTFTTAGATQTLFLDYVVARGIVSGSNGSLKGDSPVTRGELAVMLFRAEKGRDATAAENKAKAKFKDVAKGKFYTAAVKWASDNGIVTGYTSGKNKGKFLPNAKVTRQDMALMVQRYVKMKGGAVTGKALTQANRAKVSSYAKAPSNGRRVRMRSICAAPRPRLHPRATPLARRPRKSSPWRFMTS